MTHERSKDTQEWRLEPPLMAAEAAIPGRFHRGSARLSVGALLLIAGCGSPNPANIALRKQDQSLQTQVSQLQRQHAGDVASITAQQRANPAVAQLPQTQLDQLFTVHGLTLGMLTSGDNPDPNAAADSQLLVYAVPTDDDADPVKAAGSFDVSAFDLADASHPVVGHWTFTTAQTRSMFQAHLSLYTYVLACPWQTKPAHAPLTVRVTFRDELTGRRFTAEKNVTVRPPAA